MMSKKKQRYDPNIYGELKAKFLENLADEIPEFYEKKKDEKSNG